MEEELYVLKLKLMHCLFLKLLYFNDFLCYWGSWSKLARAGRNISAVLNSSGAVSVPPSVSSGRCLQLLLVPSACSGCSKPKWIYSACLFYSEEDALQRENTISQWQHDGRRLEFPILYCPRPLLSLPPSTYTIVYYPIPLLIHQTSEKITCALFF